MNHIVLAFVILFMVLLALLTACITCVIWMPGRSGADFTRSPTPAEREIEKNLQLHVEKLAGEIGERSVWRYDELEACAAYIRQILEELGYAVKEQPYRVLDKRVRNLEVEIAGGFKRDEIVLVGAHYDSAIGAPGANDNASGVAALLELARLLAGRQGGRTVRLVFFTNEEAPFFQTPEMGSLIYALRSHRLKEKIVAMLCLETLGYFSNEPNSQQYPFPFSLFYPNAGNFLAFVGNLASRRLVHQTISSFRRHSAFPSEGAAAPEWITGISWSDHWSFWQQNYPAVMLTDTAPFRYPYYHTELDTPDKVDYSALARIVQGLHGVVSDLAGDQSP